MILDSRLRTPPSARVVRSARTHPTLIYTTRSAPAARERRLAAAGVEVVRVRAAARRVSPGRVFEDLGRRDVMCVLVEGGGEVHASLLSAGLVDKVVLFIAPLLLGGRAAVPVVGGTGPARPGGAIRLARWSARRLGDGLVLEGYPTDRRV